MEDKQINKQKPETMLKKKEITIHWMQKPINDSAIQTQELRITTAATWYPTLSIKLLLDIQKISVVFKLPMPLKILKKISLLLQKAFTRFWCKSLLSQTHSQNSFVCEFCFYKHWSTCLMLLNHCLFHNTRVLGRGRELLRGYSSTLLHLNCIRA